MSTSMPMTVTTATSADYAASNPTLPFSTILPSQKNEHSYADLPKELLQIIMEYNLSLWMLEGQTLSPHLYTHWSRILKLPLPFEVIATTETIPALVNALKDEARFLCIPAAEIETADNEILSFRRNASEQQRLLTGCFLELQDALDFTANRQGASTVAGIISRSFTPPCSGATDVDDGWNASAEYSVMPRLCIASDTLETLPHAVFQVPNLRALVLRCPNLTSFLASATLNVSSDLDYCLKYVSIECSQKAVPSLIQLLHTSSPFFTSLNTVILKTYPEITEVPPEVQTFINERSQCKVSWNGIELQSTSLCTIS